MVRCFDYSFFRIYYYIKLSILEINIKCSLLIINIDQMDVSNAFLHGDIDYDVFMERPQGFCKDRTMVCKRQKAIYGLKVAPRIWNRCIDDFLINSLRFSRSSLDFCLYFKRVKEGVIYVLVYVDDLLIVSDSCSSTRSFKAEISSRFNVVNLGKVDRFLEMEINYNVEENVMTISQANFISKVAERFGVENAKPVYTPIEKDLNLSAAEEVCSDLPFRQLVECLLYISICSRPDVSFAVNYLSRFMNSYSRTHYRHLKRVLIYTYITVF